MILATPSQTVRQRASRRAAFTLLEVLVVVAILVILAGVGVAATTRYLEDARKSKAQTSCKGIADAIQNDPETDVKKKAVFALSQLPKEEGVPQLIRVADTNANLTIRKEAFFWLGQSGDPRALAYLENVLKK